MARIDPQLRALLDGAPDLRLEAIVTASDSLDELLPELGCDVQVDHVYRLLRGVAVTATAAALRRLAASSMVESIEPVRRVKHC